ncbi:transposase [Streptomyces massasporeus]|uniref:transposase n=1 Tax=Streptomyces massasporeus TaxID=67324 RepID=UPI0034542095
MGCGKSFSRLLPHLQYVHRAGAGGELTTVVLAAIIYVATTGCTWRQLPPVFGASWQTVHRRFTYWSKARVWAKLHRVVLDRLGANGELDWSRCAIDSVSIRAVKGGH